MSRRHSSNVMHTEMLPPFVRDIPQSEYDFDWSMGLVGHVNSDYCCNCEPGTLLLRIAALQMCDYVREIVTLEYHAHRWGVFRCKGPEGMKDVSVFPSIEFATLRLETYSTWPRARGSLKHQAICPMLEREA